MSEVLDDSVILIQTDTTVGFISKNQDNLKFKKQRPSGKEFLKATSSFKRLNSFVRVPKKFRRFVRLSDKTTFIYNNSISIRVVKYGKHHSFLKNYGNFFSSSANLSGHNFQKDISIKLADIIYKDERGFSESVPSKIYKLSKIKILKIR